jgi:hypothetical protein
MSLDAAICLIIFICCLLFIGEPDLYDAIIIGLTK